MSFTPPFCPHEGCAHHVDPPECFYQRRGTYRAECRPHPIPRFRCKACWRTFSRQTFHYSYRQSKPHLDHKIVLQLLLGAGQRPLARSLGISRSGLERKLKRMWAHARQFHVNLLEELRDPEVRFQFDELETFETDRSTRPVTIPVVIEEESMFLVDACVEPIPASGKMTPRRRAAIARLEEKEGKRPNRSRVGCARALATAAKMVSAGAAVRFGTDKKKSYPGVIREAFPGHAISHRRTASKRKRDENNPLFRINLMAAKLRADVGRLRRRSWFVSKKRTFLEQALSLLITVRNWCWPRFNKDAESPAMLLGFLDRRLDVEEVLSWAQHWGRRSLHPASSDPVMIRDHRRVP